MSKTILTHKQLGLIIKMIKSKNDYVCYVNNPCLGKVYLPYGTYGDIKDPNNPKGGYGYEHIIQKRYESDKLSIEQLASLIILTMEKVKTINPIYWKNDRYLIIDKGIRLSIQKNFLNAGNTWIVTSFPEQKPKSIEIKKEARDSIQSGIEQYRYFSEFSDIRTQIGALTSTIDIVRDAFNKVNQGK